MGACLRIDSSGSGAGAVLGVRVRALDQLGLPGVLRTWWHGGRYGWGHAARRKRSGAFVLSHLGRGYDDDHLAAVLFMYCRV